MGKNGEYVRVDFWGAESGKGGRKKGVGNGNGYGNVERMLRDAGKRVFFFFFLRLFFFSRHKSRNVVNIVWKIERRGGGRCEGRSGVEMSRWKFWSKRLAGIYGDIKRMRCTYCFTPPVEKVFKKKGVRRAPDVY